MSKNNSKTIVKYARPRICVHVYRNLECMCVSGWVRRLKIQPGSGKRTRRYARTRGIGSRSVGEGNRKILDVCSRANQDLRFIIYNVQERAKENLISSFSLYQTTRGVSSSSLQRIPFRVPSLPVSFSFVPESLSFPLSLAHARGHFIGHRLCRADVKVYYILACASH